jgi:hypothetical protein
MKPKNGTPTCAVGQIICNYHPAPVEYQWWEPFKINLIPEVRRNMRQSLYTGYSPFLCPNVCSKKHKVAAEQSNQVKSSFTWF